MTRGFSAEGVVAAPPGQTRELFMKHRLRLAVGSTYRVEVPENANLLIWSVVTGSMNISFGEDDGGGVPDLHIIGPGNPAWLPLPDQAYVLTVKSAGIVELIATVILGRRKSE